ncbi:hypothetical protein EWM64_g3074 [Hericium alpestre]|uniref:Integrase core domain-containing protein n=1 Tax=Hericium alpestre TaxID=135208 RepID=A0A4Z0A3N5_9AGAM|nr:hypothetical protein EWM64_g3074 [Hericium alpestre]
MLEDAYQHARRLLRQEDSDPLRLRVIAARLHSMVPLLTQLAAEVDDRLWAELCAQYLGRLIGQLRRTASAVRDDACDRYTKAIDERWLRDATAAKRKLPFTQLSRTAHVHRSTFYRALKRAGLPTSKFSNVPDDQLDALVRAFKIQKPTSGYKFADAFLRVQCDTRVPRSRICGSMRRVDALGQALRHNGMIQRRRYEVPRPNHLWHCDGHHKLIKWGIVIHGFIDGYCRTVTGLRASTNNLPETVLDVFKRAIDDYGLPSRMRGDRGADINTECKTFQDQWNHHSVSGSNMHNRTPSDMRLLASTEQGIYPDEDNLAQVEPALLQEHYGVDGPPAHRRRGQTGAGHPLDEEDAEDDAEEPLRTQSANNLAAQIAADQGPNVRHEPIEVSRHANPFPTFDVEKLFWAAFHKAQAAHIVPDAMMLTDAEWGFDGYPVQEDIPLGTRNRRALTVALPVEVPYSCARFILALILSAL